MVLPYFPQPPSSFFVFFSCLFSFLRGNISLPNVSLKIGLSISGSLALPRFFFFLPPPFPLYSFILDYLPSFPLCQMSLLLFFPPPTPSSLVQSFHKYILTTSTTSRLANEPAFAVPHLPTSVPSFPPPCSHPCSSVSVSHTF